MGYMGIQEQTFGHMPDGRAVQRITLIGEGGLAASLLTYGATLQALTFGGRDVVLGYDTLDEYRTHESYQGATVGRYANRIAGGRFVLGGVAYDVGCNEGGRGHLHGGREGFDKKLWDAETLEDRGEPSVRFSYTAADGEEGYPGQLEVAVTFTVTRDNALRIRYEASSERDTVLNLTNHAYFNLNGYDGGDVLDTSLRIEADAYTPVDERLIPTGERRPVADTPFDFRQAKPIGRDSGAADDQLALGGGYDHNFVLGDGFKRAVTATAPRSGIRLECWTDQPGVQLYTANGLDVPAGKGGIALYRHQGFCLETQHFPDSPNHPDFPSTMLRAGELFESVTEYRFYA